MKIEIYDESRPNGRHKIITIDMAVKKYTDPKLYIPKINGKPTVAPGKHWYVWFRWTYSDGSRQKFKYSKKINFLKTVQERKAAGEALKKGLAVALDRGWVPGNKKQEETSDPKKIDRGNIKTLASAMEFAMEIKRRSGKKETTLHGYEFHMNKFLEWAKNNGFYGMDVRNFTLDHFYQFHDYLRFEYVKEDTKEPLSGSSVNNFKRSISALFSTMKNERLIDSNFIKDIPAVDSEPVNNKPFTVDQILEIKEYLAKHDPYLIHFISFMLYPLLRPREICRLRVRDINTTNWFFSVETKTSSISYRRIIDKIKPTLAALNIEGKPGSFHIFTNENEPKDWSSAKLKSRYDHFGERFRVVKKALGYGREYGLYSCRHTAILDLYYSLQKRKMNEQEILFKLMPITQHKSIAGLKNYLRNLKMIMPADHSDIYTIDF